ncbi:hypothetical protein [Longimicrobium sp.]|uniref:hypothetical protein n=1 Tax=Longimicrobium sp. TaxID=2029185 RepID=UPI002B64A5B3|nr:hypothetical protein [Longimicrobium sp.]HSU16915.1 hypothetical protein [Longimicrobium sp.]
MTPRLAAAAALVLAAACGKPGCLRVAHPAALLERPYPVGYTTTRKLPNRVLATLQPGRYELRGREMKKDFMVYEVRAPQGYGYVIAEPGVEECSGDATGDDGTR